MSVSERKANTLDEFNFRAFFQICIIIRKRLNVYPLLGEVIGVVLQKKEQNNITKSSLWFQTCIIGVFIPSVPSKLEEGQLTTSTLCLPGG